VVSKEVPTNIADVKADIIRSVVKAVVFKRLVHFKGEVCPLQVSPHGETKRAAVAGKVHIYPRDDKSKEIAESKNKTVLSEEEVLHLRANFVTKVGK
jgi:hypothetical protein